ncbi:hypothetical protein AMJ52_01195 [candidate division TA06 bacterium DG_78]|uniref:Secretion system C-terminal sorting domain-containing protein n=1 Tax=candidate division TA06 bacterium DG_78 TaxID=1703772 RepID=A0A0S7YHY5_UNCT6|nr:MAG: hypothetical protein AMJ52_01195 [candidate division TA06 bacterium DG_78]
MVTRSNKWKGILMLGCLLVLMNGVLAHAQTQKWVYTHDGPATAFSVKYGNNNVYAAGYIELDTLDGTDFIVVSIDNAGNENWVVTYNGTGNADDQANYVFYGADGNIYAAGKIVGSTTDNDFAVVSLNSSGGENWLYTTDGGASEGDVAQAVVYGDDGAVYAAGNANVSAGNQNFVILKLTADGTLGWVYLLDGSANSADAAHDMIYGPDGNIYAAGFSTETGNSKDFLVVSVDTAGTERWTYTLNGTNSQVDQARSIVYGTDGYLYAAGWTRNGGNEDITIVKLDLNGTEQWVFKSDTSGNDRALSLAYGEGGHLYVAGYIKGSSNDYGVMCVDTAGTKQWTYKRNGSSGFQIPNDQANAICAGTDGNAYATGFLQNENTNQDLLTPSLGSDGTVHWQYTMNMPANTNDVGRDIHWGADNRLYIAGRLGGGNGSFGVICLDPTPVPEIWTYPSFIMVMIDSGETTDRELKIANVGVSGTTLEWSLTERPPADWLHEDTTNGALSSGDTAYVTLTLDATQLAPGAYHDTLDIASNDPVNPLISVWVKLTIPPTGIEEFTDEQQENRCDVISPFFTKVISLQFTQPSETTCNITLYNILGTRVYEVVLTSTPSSLYLDDKGIATLSHGIYFLSVSRPGIAYPVMKLVKY